ncbi:TetR/AcrR family transcriptional regulator [Hydrogenobaculum sp.]
MPRTKDEKRNQIIKVACELFAKKGYYNTTIPDIANALGMSVGNIYNYFESKEELAKETMLTVSKLVGEKLSYINSLNISTKEKIGLFVKNFFDIAKNEPELMNYFLKVFLANREVFKDGCEGFACVKEIVTETMILLSDGVEKKELRNQEFFTAFSTMMGSIGGIVFLYYEGVLDNDLDYYEPYISENIYMALKA